MSTKSMSPFEAINLMFQGSLCGLDFSLEPEGYFNVCKINTYLLALPQVLLLLWIIPQLTPPKDGSLPRTKLKHFKIFLAAAHVVVTTLYGPLVFNIASMSVSFAWLFVSFLCAFMDLNGIAVPRFPLLSYYFLNCLVYGYFCIAGVAKGVNLATDESIHAGAFMFLTSFLNACARDIGDSFEAAQ